MKNERIVLCRPRGGLSDMLANIEKCYRYCKKYKRKLFVDGNIGGFRDDFSNYFIPLDTNISFEKFNFLTPPFNVFPKCFYSDLYNNEMHYNGNIFNFTTKDEIPITFDLKKNYEEQILVHAQCGGGCLGILALARLDLKEDIKLHIKSIIEDLKKQAGNKGKYYAIHVRNTDYKTDYKSYFNDIKNKLDKTSFLCTDDYECQQYAKMFFGEKVKSVTDVPDLSSCPIKNLHENGYIDRYKTNVGTLTDLFILACAEKIYESPLVAQAISGYFILAKRLHENRRIINNMLYREANNLISYHFALFECQVRYVFTIILQYFRKFFNLLHDYGILFTVRYILRKLFIKEPPKEQDIH